jgi:hypothetical protein
LKTFWINPHAFKKKDVNDAVETETGKQEDHEEVEKVENQESAPIRKKDKRKNLKTTKVVKKDRLVHWVYQLLQSRLKVIVGSRSDCDQTNELSSIDFQYFPQDGKTSLDEVTERIELPKFHEVNTSHVVNSASYESITLSQVVNNELKSFVEIVASLYHENPFHNFEHACHVTMVRIIFRCVLLSC